MAPALLESAERHDVSKARDALVKCFKWVPGSNQLVKPMLMPELRLTVSFAGSEGRITYDQIQDAARFLPRDITSASRLDGPCEHSTPARVPKL